MTVHGLTQNPADLPLDVPLVNYDYRKIIENNPSTMSHEEVLPTGFYVLNGDNTYTPTFRVLLPNDPDLPQNN